MSFCASRNVLQVKFFCILSWSSPVITITMKIPLRNCFQKFCLDAQSSMTKRRDIGLSLTACTASAAVISSSAVTLYIIRRSAPSRQSVCNVSVHTSVLMPPRQVYSQMSATITTTVSGKGTPTPSSTKRCNNIHTT